MALGFCAWAHDRPWTRRAGRVARADPGDAAFGASRIGLAFLIAPSGWIVRALSPWLTGWTLPPDVATVGDPRGIALVLGLL